MYLQISSKRVLRSSFSETIGSSVDLGVRHVPMALAADMAAGPAAVDAAVDAAADLSSSLTAIAAELQTTTDQPILYERSATLFAAVCSILFIFIGVAGE